jgi:hypothetical protein
VVIVPITIADAREFIVQHHRHHKPPQSGLFACACAIGDVVNGVAIVGRPSSRLLQDGWTCEVTRLATDGTRNACSILYSACWRAARALGYRKIITYTLASEGGASLRGAGWRIVCERAGGGSWSRKARPRIDSHPLQTKLRWERARDE